MIEYSTPKIVVNPPGQDLRLSRDQVWQALLWKAEFPTLFVKPILECTVLETFDDGILREILHRDTEGTMRLQERVFYEPQERMTFLRLNGSVLGRILNLVETDDDGELTLRFAFTLAINGADHGGERDRNYLDEFSEGYVQAVNGLIATAREAARSGEDPTAELARARSVGAGGQR